MADLQAFPLVIDIGQGVEWHKGMTLRDYFAAKAMQGWAANPAENGASIQVAALWSYEMADAMLKAREEGSNG